MTMMTTRSYSILSRLDTFEERLKYLRLSGSVGRETFGFDRHLNQAFYNSQEWRSVRDYIIVRDNGFDLGVPDREIGGGPVIHHMNPIRVSDIQESSDFLLDPEYLITTSHNTHNAIHYGVESNTPPVIFDRRPNDTKLW